MAQYPTATPTFTTKQDGTDYPQAAHINDVQAEITAIGGALRTGLSHSLTLLSTNGLTVGGVISGVVPTVKLTHSADQAVASTTWTGLSWDTESVDTVGMHSTSANSSRITFAQSTGVYAVGASIEFNPNSSGYRVLRLMLNDATGIGATLVPASTVAALQHPLSVQGLVRVTSTSDYVTAVVFQNSGSTASITNSTLYGTAFWAFKVTA